MKKEKKELLELLQMRLDSELKRNFQKFCDENRITMSDYLRKSIEEAVNG